MLDIHLLLRVLCASVFHFFEEMGTEAKHRRLRNTEALRPRREPPVASAGTLMLLANPSPFYRSPTMNKLIVASLLSLCVCSVAVGQSKPRQYPSITWEKFKASGPELKQIGWLAVRHAKDIPSSPWSVGCETLDRDSGQVQRLQGLRGRTGRQARAAAERLGQVREAEGRLRFRLARRVRLRPERTGRQALDLPVLRQPDLRLRHQPGLGAGAAGRIPKRPWPPG